jgi:hypothetical protein
VLMSLLQALQRSVRVESQANRIDMHRVNALNRQVFANTSFRHNQLILIKAAIQGSDILGVLPTNEQSSRTNKRVQTPEVPASANTQQI